MTDFSPYIVNPGPKVPVSGLKAAVTTDSAIVTETMIKILQSGGNAADAGIAGCLVQAAVEPFMTNHAGMVTFLYYCAKDHNIHQLDSLGGFPSGLRPFKPVPTGNGPYTAISPSGIIPGFMPGLKAIYERFASLPWKQLCNDAIRWAESGHPVSTFEYGVNIFGQKFTTYFPEGRDFYQPGGFFPNVGDIFVPTGLAETLRGVAEAGPDYMISGPWAERFVKKANEMGWRIQPDHMSETPPRWIEPLRFPHEEYEIVCLGPPQAQGFFVAIAMGVLKHLGVRGMQPGSAEHLWAMGHALRQGMRHWEYAQDESVYEVPRKEIVDDAYHAHLAKLIRRSRPKVDLSDHIRLTQDVAVGGTIAFESTTGAGRPRLGSTEAPQPSGSCELAVVDSAGNWVQMMNTLQGSGIPGMVIGGVPMVGSHSTFGALQSAMDITLVKGAKARCIVGNTLVLKDKRPVLSAGTPGNAFCTIPQVLCQVLDLKRDPYSAVDAPRMLPMTEARGITIEDRLRPGVVEELHQLGIRVSVAPAYDFHMGSFAVISREERDNTYTAVADPRRCGVAGGIR